MRSFVRVIAGVLVAAGLAGCSEVLYSGLAEVEANRMRAALMAAGIDARKVGGDDGRWNVEVPTDAAGRALSVLEAAGLPAQKYGTTIDAMRTDALVPSASEDRTRLAHGLSQELSQTISTFDGVLHARVHLSIPDRSGPGQRSAGQPSASVLVRHRPGYNLAAMSGPIRLLVARSVDGLTPDRVSVITVASDPRQAAAPAAVPPQAAPAHGVALVPIVAAGCVGIGLGVAMSPLLRRVRLGDRVRAVLRPGAAHPADGA